MSKNKVTQVYNTTDDELVSKILLGFDKRLIEFEKKFKPKEPAKWITRNDVASILGISLVSVSAWTKRGILKPTTIGSNRVRFNRDEVMALLTNKK